MLQKLQSQGQPRLPRIEAVDRAPAPGSRYRIARGRQHIEVVDRRAQGVGDDLLAAPVCDAANAAPILALAELVHQLDQGCFTLKTNNRIGTGDALQHFLRIEAGVVSTDGDVGAASALAQRPDHASEGGRHVLENEREADHVRPQARDHFRHWLGVARIGRDATFETGVAHRREKIPQAQIVLILKPDQEHRTRGPVRHRRRSTRSGLGRALRALHGLGPHFLEPRVQLAVVPLQARHRCRDLVDAIFQLLQRKSADIGRERIADRRTASHHAVERLEPGRIGRERVAG